MKVNLQCDSCIHSKMCKFKEDVFSLACNSSVDGHLKISIECDWYFNDGEIPRMQKELVCRKDEFDNLLKRFRHLMESKFIASFDEWDSSKNDYKLDISEADKIINRPF